MKPCVHDASNTITKFKNVQGQLWTCSYHTYIVKLATTVTKEKKDFFFLGGYDSAITIHVFMLGN